ncbi:hypothetical protein HaLaN_01377, partial [Haematococcus lacustris]
AEACTSTLCIYTPVMKVTVSSEQRPARVDEWCISGIQGARQSVTRQQGGFIPAGPGAPRWTSREWREAAALWSAARMSL